MSDAGDSDISPRERAHQRRRDRKRETRMVVDNAGLRRVLGAVRHRQASPRPDATDADETPPPAPG
ncbi:MAG: hypothetical protein ACREQ5_11290 [Candidatus Dormibacteria bacterium]